MAFSNPPPHEKLFLHEEAESLAHVGTWVSDVPLGGSTTWSKETYRIFGIAEGMPIVVSEYLARLDPADAALIARVRARAIEDDEPYDVEYRIRRPDGDIRWVHGKATVVRDAHGKAQRLLGVVQDITEHHRALDALRASEQRYRRILENTTLGVWAIDAEGSTTFMNERMSAMLGYQPGEVLGVHVLDFVAPGSLEAAKTDLARRRARSSAEVDVELLRKDGTTIDVLLQTTPIFDATGRNEGTHAMVVDVTARKRAEHALRESEARTRLLLDSTGEGLYGMDLDGRCNFANAACVRTLGYASEHDLLGKDLHSLIHHRRRNGLPYPHDECRISNGDALETGVHVQDEVLWRADGTSFDADYRSFPVRREGARVGSIISFVDITDRRRAEEQLRQAQKMEAVGRLAGGVAHDFNNILSVILSYSSFVLDALPPGSPLRADVEEVHAAGGRATELTKQLLAFSRKQVLAPTVLDIEDVFCGLEKMLHRLLGEDIALSLTATGSPRVHADRGQLEQVVLNLAVNARDAMPNGGTLTMTASVEELDAFEARDRGDLVPGAYVRIDVSDTGAGMSPETCARVFEPFFTTKGPDKGTGLGLATVFGVVKQSGGAISVASEPRRGTRFEILLPQSQGETKATARPSSPEGARGSETILLVEDDEQVRTVTGHILRRHGYNVVDVPNAGEAMLVCEQYVGEIALLLTDVVLPRMNGRQLAERVAPVRPGMRVLYVSGYTDDEVVLRGVRSERVAFLQKPFTPSSIVRKVRDVLDVELVPPAVAC